MGPVKRSMMIGMSRVVGSVLAVGLLASVVVGCSEDEPETVPTPPSFTFPYSTTTSTTTTTTTEPDDVIDSSVTDGSAADSTPDTGSAVITPPPAPESTVTTTTEALMVQELILNGDGLGFSPASNRFPRR